MVGSWVVAVFMLSTGWGVLGARVVPTSLQARATRALVSGGAVLGVGYAVGLVPNPIALALSPYPVKGDESLMKEKAHGTSDAPVQANLRWGCDVKLADRICNYNRRWAENAGYFQSTALLKEVDPTQEITFYDSVTGKPLFIAPKGRTFKEFKVRVYLALFLGDLFCHSPLRCALLGGCQRESTYHGWPSFRDDEVVWENVRCLGDGETVSTTGTHLGHNLPDRSGNRYCINLVSIAGRPIGSTM